MNWASLQTELLARLKAKRGAQAELARRLGISRAAINAYVSSDNSIPPAHLDHILDILGIELEIKQKGDK
ncbi:helix-turn-helix domain-containing protein [Deinococcus soli (ex Cha et al. 2016)]|uniref:helix-turn-helix domain-containing protein n=1 Tax=Deinococcus soli (ex Cha et al. 2016) TaxID=1309411 RepID=UPI001669DD83|nr:helix-turn-helix transcriptional regulator [Deinococcus soli (ex Cha et al. 2016)]